jgi:hypothetical protein
LQAVGPRVFEPRRLQQFIKSSEQVLAGGHSWIMGWRRTRAAGL